MAKPADDEDERRIISEFTHLLEKSKQLFNGLRDLPQYGHKQWQSYFGRTFDVYTRLWKFQQQHRQTLDVAYGLKRWQIGEVASKIGQLYYHYYLRTSETSYLEEAYAFYLAIRGRGYYAKAGRDGGPELVVKKLRYLARFIVVCLLLRRLKLVRELVRELAKHIDEYVATYRPADELEWNMVLDEIRTFVEADSTVRVVDIDHADLPGAVGSVEPVTFCHRLGPHNAPPLERTTPSALELAEAVIVGNCGEQVKFSELTIDMYRLLQTLEREPSPSGVNPADGHHPLLANGNSATGPLSTSSGHNSLPPTLPHQNSLVHSPLQVDGAANSGCLPSQSSCRNPHKYLLYKPTFAQLFAFLSAAFKDLPPNGVLLVYLSADASRPPAPGGSAAPGNNLVPIRQRSEDLTYELGGVATNSRREAADANANANAGANAWRANAAAKRGTFVKEAHCVHPGDLLPFTRKPMLLIVDSENSGAFGTLPSLFGQPVICLMSPEVLPSAFAEQRTRGSLFSLFLHSPLLAFCAVCAQTSLTLASCDRLQAVIDKFLAEAGRILVRSRALDFAFIQFYADDFLRCLLLRFVFCCLVLRLHKGFKGSRCHPSSCPSIPEGEVLSQPVLHRLILDLASLLDVRHLFLELNERD